MKNYDKTTIIGVGICVILLFSWPQIAQKLGLVPPPAPPQETPATSTVQTPDQPVPGTATPSTAVAPKVPGVVTSPSAPAPVASSSETTEVSTAWEKPAAEPVVLRDADGLFELFIDPNGNGISGVKLENYENDPVPGKEKSNIVLGRHELPFGALDFRNFGWKASNPRIAERNEAAVTLVRDLIGPAGETGTVSEEWKISTDGPNRFDYSVAFTGTGTTDASIGGLGIEVGSLPPSTSPVRISSQRGSGGNGVMFSFDDSERPRSFSLKNLAKMDAAEAAALTKTSAQWIAVHSQYFTFCIIPIDAKFVGVAPSQYIFTDDDPVKIGRKMMPPVWFHSRAILPKMEVKTGSVSRISFTCYAGPKRQEVLAALPGPQMEKIMDLDKFLFFHVRWMGWITRILLVALTGLNNFLGGSWGYGWAIVLITIGVKVIFFPLAHKSNKSMRGMQALQPQIKELKEKYKDEPQKMYRKQQELFKENKVSQLGGCLPMVVQIPVLFGLFNTFRSAVELRHASFLWAVDLSMPDTVATIAGLPIRPLAILMSGSMLLQQRMTPSSDPSQQRMMMMMSVFFLYMFYGMPSGLTLYWSIAQALTMLQMYLTKKFENKTAAPVAVQPK